MCSCSWAFNLRRCNSYKPNNSLEARLLRASDDFHCLPLNGIVGYATLGRWCLGSCQDHLGNCGERTGAAEVPDGRASVGGSLVRSYGTVII